MPCMCACACSCAAQTQTSPQPQLSLSPSASQLLGGGKKAWVSYDEHDADAEYGFVRKRRFGVKNGSDAVKLCLTDGYNVTAATPRPATAQPQRQAQQQQTQGCLACAQQNEYDSDEEGRPPRFRTEGARRAEEHFAKIGHPLSRSQTHVHTCKCSNALELSKLKEQLAAQQAALQRNAAATARLLAQAEKAAQKNAPRQHTCGCGCVSYSAPNGQCANCGPQQGQRLQAWQQLPLQHVLDGETQVPYAESESSSQREQETKPQEPAANLADTVVAPAQQQPAQTKQKQQKPAQQRPQTAAQRKAAADLAARLAGAHLSEEAGPPVKHGLGNTLLGSPHDPRELHDPDMIDPVWRRREEARQRAKRMHALLGTTAADKGPIIDAEASRASELKQMARRVKIRAFERRHTEERLRHATSPFTRDLSETWMGIVTGKPPFCSFGNGNTAPASGGLIYGNYMTSHNVSPEKAPNNPNQKQVSDEARRVANMKRKQDAKSLRRLLKQSEASGERDELKQEERALLWEAAEGLRASSGRPSTARRPAAAAFDERAPSSSHHLAQSQRVTNSQRVVPQTQRAQDGNARNIGGGALGDPSSYSDAAVAAAAQGQQQQQQQQQQVHPTQQPGYVFGDPSGVNDGRQSGRRGQYANGVIGGNNSLDDTTARTMSVLPKPELQQTLQAW